MTALLLFVACSNPAEDTPPDMQELTWMLLHDFGTADAVDEAELLGAWIDQRLDDPEEGYALEPPAFAYVEDLSFSENLEIQNLAGGMVIHRVRGTIDQHAAVVPEVDQSFADSSYDKWERHIANGSEAGWLAGGSLLADDAIEKNGGFGIVLPYPMLRDYRWFEMERGPGILTRSVIYDEGWADDTNGIIGGFTIELWMSDGDSMIWMNATWTQVHSIVGDNEDFYTNQIIQGSTEAMAGTELYVAGPE